MATPRCGGRCLPGPVPDHRTGPARLLACEHGAEDRPCPGRNRVANPDPPNHRERAPSPRQPGYAAPRPVTAGHKKRGPALSNGIVRAPTGPPTGLQRPLRRTNPLPGPVLHPACSFMRARQGPPRSSDDRIRLQIDRSQGGERSGARVIP